MDVKKCTVCNIKIDEDNYKKDRNICENFYNINRKKYYNKEKKIEKPKVDNVNNPNNNIVSKFENHRYVNIGPSNVGKTYYMLKVLEKIGDKRPIHIITRSPNQYPNYKTSNEIKPINKYKGSVVIFDDMLGAKNSSQIDEFFTRGRHEDLDNYYISQSYFGLPRQSIRNNSDRLLLFKQTLRDVQSMYYDIGAYDMNYDEFKQMCHKAWDEKFNYLCIDITKNKNDGKYRIFNESKNTYIECICESEAFEILLSYSYKGTITILLSYFYKSIITILLSYSYKCNYI